ncbi:MAG: hypothetical protein HQL68_06570 [Magnetococcales bacterium]|nr:hypothetical protein [Magnetococcales bacterium]
MATFVKTQSGTWKALIRRKGHPTTIRTFPKKRDAENCDLARVSVTSIVSGRIYVAISLILSS